MKANAMYATLVKNSIYMNGTDYRCFGCNENIISLDNAIAHAANDRNHCQQMKTTVFLENINIDEDQCIKLVNHGIVIINNREYMCTICCCLIPLTDQILKHIEEKKHVHKHRKISAHSSIDDTKSDESNDQHNRAISVLTNEEEEFHLEHLEVSLSNGSNLNGVDSYSNNLSADDSTEIIVQNSSCVKANTQEENLANYCVYQCKENLPPEVPVVNDGLIYCNGCNNYLKPNSALLYHRMFHLTLESGNVNDIISFSVRKNKKSVYCLVCDCMMKDENDLEKHLTEIKHQRRLVMFYYLNDHTLANLAYMNPSLYSNTTVPHNMNNFYNVLDVEYNKYLQYVNYHVYQSTPSALVQSSFMNYKLDHQSMINPNVPIIHDQSMPVHVNYLAFPSYFCFICQYKFADENLLLYHFNYDYYHKYRMEAINIVLKDKNLKLVPYLDNQVILCTKCQIRMIDVNGVVNHIFELQHVMENDVEHKKVVSNYQIVMDNMCESMYTCPICSIDLSHDYLMVEHLESECHKKNIQEYYTNVNCILFEKIIFSCPPCNMHFFNDNTLLKHLCVSHQNNSNSSKNTFFKCNDTNTTTNKTNQNINSIPLQHTDYTHNNLVNFNLNRANLKTVESNANEKNIDNRGINSENSSVMIRKKNLINFSQRYVKLCVESGEENIFKINPDRIKMLQLGIRLTFPYKLARGCIPCGCEIPDDPQLIYEHLRTEGHEKNLLELKESHEYFEDYPDQFSDLDLAKQYMYEDSDELVKCLACDTGVQNCDESLHIHVSSNLHIQNCKPWINSANELFQLFNSMFENLWYYIEKFFCNVCCTHFVFEVDYARHLESPQHMKEVEYRILRKQNLQFDYCIVCSYFWYARSDQFKIHCSKDSHKYILKSRDFTVPDMPDLAKTLLTLVEKTVNDLILESDEVASSDNDIETQLLESVEAVVKSKYPSAKAYLFGSRISNLGIKDSDLDIYLDCENQYDKLNSINECQEQLLTVQECFHKYQDIWIIEEIVLRTRVPIIKIRHRPTNLNCDISFINGLSVEKSKILSYYINASLPCRKMILYLKVWKTSCQLSGKKGITTFAISWLVIFYLQLQGFLPSVWDLIKLENKTRLIAGWETGISKTVPVKNIDISTTELLRGFFAYYATFDYISNVACPYLGQVMKKSQFSHIDKLPDEMNIYKLKIKQEKVDFFRLDSPMCIQEPVDLSQNLTKAVTKLHLRMFKQYCSESAAILQNNTSN